MQNFFEVHTVLFLRGLQKPLDVHPLPQILGERGQIFGDGGHLLATENSVQMTVDTSVAALQVQGHPGLLFRVPVHYKKVPLLRSGRSTLVAVPARLS